MGTIGKQSYHAETNENGMKLVSFAAMRDMVISSTYFRHPRIHLITWITKSQIDHVLCDIRHASSVLDVRTMRGAGTNFTSDHHLVKALIFCRISCKRRNHKPQRKYNTEALQNPATALRYSQELTTKIGILPEDADIDAHWKLCEEVVKTTATEILGMKPPPRQCGWRDDEYN